MTDDALDPGPEDPSEADGSPLPPAAAPATISSFGQHCIRCGEWVSAPDDASIPAAMAEHNVQHFGPWPA